MDAMVCLPLITSGVAAVMDIRTMRVDNGWLLFMMTIGFFTRVYAEGWNIIPDFILGLLFPFFILIGLYCFRMLGPGDIKLLCVLGGMFGIKKIGILMLCTLFIGGGISILILLFYGGVRERFRYFFAYVRDGLSSGTIKPYYKKGMQPENFHFTVPVFLSTVLCVGGLF